MNLGQAVDSVSSHCRPECACAAIDCRMPTILPERRGVPEHESVASEWGPIPDLGIKVVAYLRGHEGAGLHRIRTECHIGRKRTALVMEYLRAHHLIESFGWKDNVLYRVAK